MNKNIDNLAIFQVASGAIELRVDATIETVWANLDQIAGLFERDKSTISKHIKNIYSEKELEEKGTVANFATVQKEGNRDIKREIRYYNLDMIISIGYRVNSKTATKFRQRATQTLKQHITEGYTINQSMVQKNYTKFLQAVEDVKLLVGPNNLGDSEVFDLIKTFASTWFSLDAYDKGELKTTGQTPKSIKVEYKHLRDGIKELKTSLLSQGEATELFALEKVSGSLEGILGNIFQSAFGEDAYPTLEEKAAHLLYFVVKNHPFADGNKRSGAFSFVRFLQKAGHSFQKAITPEALTALTLLIATSNPKDKERVVGLVVQLLS